MSEGTRAKRSNSVTCPYCNAQSGGAFSTVTESDEAGPTKILYKCKDCGRFYTAEKVVSWRVKKT